MVKGRVYRHRATTRGCDYQGARSIKRRERRKIAGIELERAQMARTCKPQRAERDQSVALVRVPKSELRMPLQELLDMVQRVRGPIDTL